MSRTALELKDVWFSYSLEGQAVPALRGLNLSIRSGEMVAIQGPSGSGKSTLLYILGCMLRPQSGEVRVFDQNVSELSDLQLAELRNRQLGFVFQQFHLLSRATVRENILLPSRYPFESGTETTGADVARAEALALQVGLSDRLDHRPNQLSGGQQQRVAIARALLRDAPLILADEPTGNLDSQTSGDIMKLLKELNAQGRTIVVITHDPAVASQCQRVLHILDGKISEEKVLSVPPDVEPATPRPLVGTSGATNWFSLIRDSAPVALENLRRNRLRSLLTMMGVVIGVASVLSMVTLGQYTRKKVIESYATMGVNSMKFYANQNFNMTAMEEASPVQFDSLNWERDVQPLRKIFPEIHRVSPEFNAYGLSAIYGGRSIESEVTVLGVNSEALKIYRRGLALGSGIRESHVQSKSSVCVLGHEVAAKLFLKESPIGQVIQVSTQSSALSCLVIGVLKSVPTGRDSYNKADTQILMPFTYFGSGPFDYWTKQLQTLLLEVVPGTDIEKTGRKVRAFFERKYGPSGHFRASSDSVMISQMNRFLTLFTLLLGLIASLALVVGAMGITNMMLVSVNERFREIGLRKALGASDRSVRLQFITESLLLCGVAGIAGLLLGVFAYQGLIWAGTRLIPNLEMEWVWDWSAALISIVAIGLTGFFSGLTPALRAEKLQVIEALRSE